MAVTSAQTWEVAAGQSFLASLADPPNVNTLGVRIEVPGTRAIVSYYRLAVLQDGVWAVTTVAPTLPGAYVLVWRDNDGLGPGGDPLFEAFYPLIAIDPNDLDPTGVTPSWPQIDPDEIRPDVDSVAKLERVRTVDAGGADVGTFTVTTTPTAAEVEDLITDATDDVFARLPDLSINPKHYRQLQRAITLQTAVLIEGSFYKEQAADASVTLWNGLIDNIVNAVATNITIDLEAQQATGGGGQGRVLV